MTLKPLVFFGTEDFSLPSLEALVQAKWPIELVVTKPDTRRGRGLTLTPPAVKDLAEKNKIPVLQPDNLADATRQLYDSDANLAVLVAYGKIVPQEIIDIFSDGIVNVHPSLLPTYRGPSPIETAILNGDSFTGVSLMKLVAKMDAGPVYVQEEVILNGRETRLELYKKMAEFGAEMLIKNLGAIASGNLPGKVQDNSKATYTKMLSKNDGLIDFSEPAMRIERKVRAYLGFPKAQAEVFGQRIIITKARLVQQNSSDGLILPTGDGQIEIEELIAPSGRTMSGKDFIRGYQRD